ncbi:hypothetical protein JXQ31_01135 [candidate division KSB1 bacterium]|nr:hypothetical protein [candidate division KSB1 bacterium]
MKKVLIKFVLAGFILFFMNIPAVANDDNDYTQSIFNQIDPELSSKVFEGLTGISVSGQWFLKFQSGERDEKKFSEFGITRGYITIKKNLSEQFSGRITPDITIDKEGDGLGDLEMRIKYCYLQYKMKDIGLFSTPYFEFGVVHRPWIDFEQKINHYRVQSKMFFDRYDIVNSADLGFAFFSLLGGEVNNNYKKNVNSAYPGKFGSISVGVYNGGGYHAVENNINKTIEGRLSIRPLPKLVTGLQFHYHGIHGKGNTEIAPKFDLNSGIVSFESRYFVITGTYFESTGNYKGTAVDNIQESGLPVKEKVKAIKQDGYSAFAEIKLYDNKIAFIGQYDRFNQNRLSGVVSSERVIGGFAYYFVQKCKLLIDYELYKSDRALTTSDGIFEVATEVVF